MSESLSRVSRLVMFLKLLPDLDQIESDYELAVVVTKVLDNVLSEYFEAPNTLFRSFGRKIDIAAFNAKRLPKKLRGQLKMLAEMRNTIVHNISVHRLSDRQEFIGLANAIDAQLVNLISKEPEFIAKAQGNNKQLFPDVDVFSPTTKPLGDSVKVSEKRGKSKSSIGDKEYGFGDEGLISGGEWDARAEQ